MIGEDQYEGPPGVITSSTTFSYDATGNRTQMVVDGVTTNYCYNVLDQLTTEITDPASIDCDNLPSQRTSIDYVYDLKGNLSTATEKDNGLTTGTTTYTWDAMGRMQAATTPTDSIAYAYDHDGRRVQQTVNGALVTNTLWDEFSAYGDVLLETDASNTLLMRYTLGGNDLIAQTSGGAAHFYLADAQNSTRLLTDSLGNISDTYSYTAYGELLTQTGTTTNSYLYTGQQHDSLTGLYHLRARQYSPSTGRFLSRDVWQIDTQNPLELNRYVYAAANPVMWADPSGYGVDNAAIGKLQLGTIPGLTLFGGFNAALYAQVLIPLIGVTAPVLVPLLDVLLDPLLDALLNPQQHDQVDPLLDELVHTIENFDDLDISNTLTDSQIQTLEKIVERALENQNIRLYRSIRTHGSEMGSVVATGTYGFSPSGGGKYFAFTRFGARQFARVMADSTNAPQSVTAADYSVDVLTLGFIFHDPGGGDLSIQFSDEVLPLVYSKMKTPITIITTIYPSGGG